MSEYLRNAIAELQSQTDKRVIRERHEIKVQPKDYDKTIHQLGKLDTLIPNTSRMASELSDQLTTVIYAMDTLFAELKETKTISEYVHKKLLYVRDAMLQQYCCTDPTMLENYRFLEGSTDYHFRFDIICFLALMEATACLSAVPAFWVEVEKGFAKARGVVREKGQGVVPAIEFPELCRRTVISLDLRKKSLTEFNVFDIVEALKYLEFKWCIIKYSAELPDYMDLLLCRIAELYKIPQPFIIFTNIDDYMKAISPTEAVFSERMIEELCWSLRPMYKKVFEYRELARKCDVFHVPDSDAIMVQEKASDNARRMNNKKVSEDFRNIYLRYAIRPSEMPKFYRDKRGRYANAALIMKNGSHGKVSVNRMMDKLDNSAWDLVDKDAGKERLPGQKRKGVFDRAATDLMYVLLIDSWLGNLWQLEWVKIFVVYNLDLVEEGAGEFRFRVDYPLIVQSFNHFDVYHEGILYGHQNLAKAFCHWYRIMMQEPFNGQFNNRSIECYDLKDLAVLKGITH
jgi:hypothetical protein